jgi:hypothetical protein
MTHGMNGLLNIYRCMYLYARARTHTHTYIYNSFVTIMKEIIEFVFKNLMML